MGLHLFYLFTLAWILTFLSVCVGYFYFWKRRGQLLLIFSSSPPTGIPAHTLTPEVFREPTDPQESEVCKRVQQEEEEEKAGIYAAQLYLYCMEPRFLNKK